MALNILSSGSFVPYAKYNAKSGRWYTRKDEQEVEVSSPVFVIDFDNIKTGWFLFMEGQAPSVVFDASLTQVAPKPSDMHKRGFQVRLFSNAHFGGVAEFTANSMHTCNAVNDLYTQYEKDLPKNAGKLPVVAFKGVEATKDKFGTNYKPLFVIEEWVYRPAVFDAAKKTEAAKPAAAQHAVTPAQNSPAVSEF